MSTKLEAAARQALEALEHSHANEPIWKTPHRNAAAALREALAEQASALAKQQAFVDSLPAGDDKMFEQIHLWAMQSYKRHRGSTAGQQITAADNFDTHIIWAALRWAGEHQAPTQQPLTDEQKAVLRECRNKAMKWAAQAGIPECAAFGGIAQDLDWLCGQLGIAENEKGGAA